MSNNGGCAQVAKTAFYGVVVMFALSVLFFWTDVAYPQANCSTVDQQLASLEKRKIPGVYTTKVMAENGVPKVLYFIGYYRSRFVASMTVFDDKGCLSASTQIPNAMAVFELLSDAEKAALFLKTSSH
jgi:hypothetical protein